MTDIWLKALRSAFRYEYKGLISTEDLFDLSLSELDTIYQQVSHELDDISSASLLEDKNQTEIDWMTTKRDVVKAVFDIKKEEQLAREKRIRNLQEKRKIMQIIDNKHNKELEDKDIEELEKMLAQYDEQI